MNSVGRWRKNQIVVTVKEADVEEPVFGSWEDFEGYIN